MRIQRLLIDGRRLHVSQRLRVRVNAGDEPIDLLVEGLLSGNIREHAAA